MGRKKYSVTCTYVALCGLKNIVFIEKNNVAKKKNSAALRSEKNSLTPKKTIAPSPPPSPYIKLNGCSLS